MITETKEKILKVAAALFRNKSFNSTTINDIVREASVSKGSLYYYFPSKQIILYEVVSRGMSLTVPYAKRIFNSELAPKDKLREIIKSHVFNSLENIDYVSVAFRERGQLEEQYRSKYIKLRDEHQSFFEKIIRFGIEQGIFPQVNVKLTTYAILDICNGPVRWYKPHGPLKPEQIAEEYSSLICDFMMSASVPNVPSK